LGELKPTKIVLQLAYRSTRATKGLVKDILIKVSEFIYPVDFVVLKLSLLLILIFKYLSFLVDLS